MFVQCCITGVVYIKMVVKTFELDNTDITLMVVRCGIQHFIQGHSLRAQPSLSTETSSAARNVRTSLVLSQ